MFVLSHEHFVIHFNSTLCFVEIRPEDDRRTVETYFQKLSNIFFNSKFDNIPLSHVRSTDTLLFFIRKSNFGPEVELSNFLLQFEPYTVLNVFL